MSREKSGLEAIDLRYSVKGSEFFSTIENPT
jgi:hypothetical protein